MREYEVVEMNFGEDKIFAIKFTEAPYAGLVFSYGKVEMAEDDVADELQMKFDYTVHNEPKEPYVTAEFEPYVGDFLVELISQMLEDKEIIYRGGTDPERPKRDE